MGRNRPRKTEMGRTSGEAMKAAVKAVLENKRKVRQVAREFNIPRRTLNNYITKCENNVRESGHLDYVNFSPNYKCCQVFTAHEECLLAQYIIKASVTSWFECHKC